jgi:seryl-tRNA synthetase
MHDIKWIRDNPEAFDRGLARRGLAPEAARLIAIDERRRAIIRVLESALSRRKSASEEIRQARTRNDEATVWRLTAEVEECKTTISTTEAEQKLAQKELDEALLWIPNLPLDEVPDGADEHGNVYHHKYDRKRSYPFANQPKQHFELGEALGQMDFQTAAKLSGARFVVLKKELARMERALGQFMLDLHTNQHGYTEVAPPLLVKDDVMFGTTQLPKFREDQFHVAAPLSEQSQRRIADLIVRKNYNFQVLGTKEFDFPAVVEAVERGLAFKPLANFWLIPTAEVPLTNLVRESIIDEAELPLRLTALTPCFRAEAGAAGKDTRGMIRQHQFTKVELVSITTPEQSRDEHERMLSCAEEVLRRLDLHYRVMTLCTGDMGFASQKTYDIEVWLPGQNMYREISSCSVCGDFQARRMAARYRPKDPSTKAQGRQIRHVHTLNGSGVAVGRALIAVMETYQQADGSIAVPDVLQSYMGGMKVVAAK